MSPSGAAPLQVLAAAVTPVVMISATAILISGVNSRFIAIADRTRALSHEFRDPSASTQRRELIAKQMLIFRRRLKLVCWALRTMYVATACLVCVALLLSATLWRETLVEVSVPLFVLGIVLIFAALVCELLELQAANHTILLEIQDVRQKDSRWALPGSEAQSKPRIDARLN